MTLPNLRNNTLGAESLPVSEEMLGAWLEGNLDADESRMMEFLLENNPELSQMAVSAAEPIAPAHPSPFELDALDCYLSRSDYMDTDSPFIPPQDCDMEQFVDSGHLHINTTLPAPDEDTFDDFDHFDDLSSGIDIPSEDDINPGDDFFFPQW